MYRIFSVILKLIDRFGRRPIRPDAAGKTGAAREIPEIAFAAPEDGGFD